MWNGHLRVRRLVRLAPVVIFLLAAPKARAQRQTTGVPGSASATTTINGTQLSPGPRNSAV